MQLNLWEGTGNPYPPLELAVEDAPSGWVWTNQKPLVFSDLMVVQDYPKLIDVLRQRGLRSYCVLPLTTPRQRLGALGFASAQPSAYREVDVEFLRRVSELVGLAVENSLIRQALNEEKNRLRALVDVNSTLAANHDLRQLFPAISNQLRQVVAHDFAGLAVYDAGNQGMRAYALAPSMPEVISEDQTIPLEQSITASAFSSRQSTLVCRHDLTKLRSPFANRMLSAGIQSIYCIPLVTSTGVVGTVNFGSKEETGFSAQDQELLDQVAHQLAIAMENDRAFQEIEQLKDKLAEEKLYLQDEIRSELNFEEIIGDSPNLKRALSQATTVAPSDATVLILGN